MAEPGLNLDVMALLRVFFILLSVLFYTAQRITQENGCSQQAKGEERSEHQPL